MLSGDRPNHGATPDNAPGCGQALIRTEARLCRYSWERTVPLDSHGYPPPPSSLWAPRR